jgi:glucose/arabinose dehydrogenase
VNERPNDTEPAGAGSEDVTEPANDASSANSRRGRMVVAVVAGAAVVLALLGLALVVLLGGDDSDDPDELVDPGQAVEPPAPGDRSGTTTPPTEPDAPPLAEVGLTTTEIGQFDLPIAIENRVDDTSLYVAQRGGQVLRVTVDGEGANRTYTPDDQPLLDLSDDVVTEGEQGLLDIELSPDGATLYVHYSQAPDGATQIVSYTYDGNVVDEASRKDILHVEQPFSNHNGGSIEFGPDGYLYIGLGDGGSGGDPEANGQNTSSLLGKLLRIDPEGAGPNEPYRIPDDSPFADGSGGQPEVWAYGLRNPWRFSFDTETDDLWIGDVGQNAWEEIDFLPASNGGGRGANLGWNEMEGSQPFEGGSNPPDGVLPVFQYPNPDAGRAVTGGVVYRGTANPDLTGTYLFGDFYKTRLRGIRMAGGAAVDEHTFDATVESLVSFGQDNAGEVYAVSLSGPIYRLDP